MHKTAYMKILLVGEYSRLHLTLAEGLRYAGHEVTLASDGDGFKNYPRDIDLSRQSSGIADTLASALNTIWQFRQFKGYDVVQLINPNFTTQNVRLNNYLYKCLKKHNRKIFLGAFGDDSYWVRACMSNKIFKYSEFFVSDKPTNLKYNTKLTHKWIDSPIEVLNKTIAQTSNGIIACLYEYYMSYKSLFDSKLTYIPLPINTDALPFRPIKEVPKKVVFFIGINRDRSEYKGTDIMERALLRLKDAYPDEVTVIRAESISYDEYNRMMELAHVVLDQLYSYTPAMNALNAMAMGKIAVSGGEPEMYDLLDEKVNHPVVNVFPSEQDVFDKLEFIVKNKHLIPKLSEYSRKFVEDNHYYKNIVQDYLSFWNRIE